MQNPGENLPREQDAMLSELLFPPVMPGLDPGIHVLAAKLLRVVWRCHLWISVPVP